MEKSNKILIVIDIQKGFMAEPDFLLASEKVEKFIRENAENYSHIFFTRFENTDNSLYKTRMGWSGLCTEDERQFTFTPPENAIVLTKYTYGLSQTDLNRILSLNAKEVDVCGVQTDACVYAISFQLFDNGVFPNILINYCATNKSRKQFAKEALIHQFGKVDERP